MTAQRDFELAVAGEGLRVVLHPIVRLASSGASIAGLECLTRGPRGGNLEHPAVLFGYARQIGREAEIDLACIREALSGLSGTPPRQPLFLNVHGASIEKDGSFIGSFLEIVEAAGFSPSDLVLEIVEHLPFRPGRRFATGVEALRSFGIRLALDDFGSRNAGFSLLLDCRPEFVKLDTRLVRECDRDTMVQAVLRSLVGLAAETGSSLIAEGVESPGERDLLFDLGIELQQGFVHFPVLELEKFRAGADRLFGSQELRVGTA
jgi:EAL domain-containing protein (putative c-di-GMP-specific phosphodiesterase class I)